jgi:putative membrane protein
MMYWNGMGGWGYVFMALSLLLFWGLVITGIVVLVRRFGGSTLTRGQSSSANPEQILAERYARGEIDDEEYRRRLDTLRLEGQVLEKS